MRVAGVLVTLVVMSCAPAPTPGSPSPPDAASPAADASPADSGAADGAQPNPIDSGADAGPRGRLFAFVGSEDGNLHVYDVDSAAATLVPRGTIAAGQSPSFVAVDTARRRVFAVEGGGGGRVRSFTFDPQTATLTANGMVGSQGAGPAHVTVDPSGKWVMVANYTAGNVAVFSVDAAGALGAPTDTPSPGVRAHQILTDRAGAHVFVPCLGSDLVAQFSLDGATGKLVANTPASVALPAGAGPRHMAFHPTEKFAYVINELASTMTSMTYDAVTGRLTPIETTTTLPAGFMGANTTAEVVTHPSGSFVYGSNRGHDSIVAFKVDTATGKLTLTAHQATGGATPRSFAMDDDGTMLVVANQGTGTLNSFRVDATTGALTPASVPIAVAAPSYVGIWRVP